MRLRGRKENINPQVGLRKNPPVIEKKISPTKTVKQLKIEDVMKMNENIEPVKRARSAAISENVAKNNSSESVVKNSTVGKVKAKDTAKNVLGELQASTLKPFQASTNDYESVVKNSKIGKVKAKDTAKSVLGELQASTLKPFQASANDYESVVKNSNSGKIKAKGTAKSVLGGLQASTLKSIQTSNNDYESIVKKGASGKVKGKDTDKSALSELQPPTLKPIQASAKDYASINNTQARKSLGTKRKREDLKPTKRKKVVLCKTTVKPSYVTSDCFGFNNSEPDEAKPYVDVLTKFDPTRPFRLAFYVHPSKRIRIDPAYIEKLQQLNPSLNVTNMSMMSKANNTTISTMKKSTLSPVRQEFKVPMSSTPFDNKKIRLVQRKITDVLAPSSKAVKTSKKYTSFFEASQSSESESENIAPELKEKESLEKFIHSLPRKYTSTEESTDEEIFPKPQRRRSYVKKRQRVEQSEEDEPSSDEVMKSIEKTKKKAKTKKKELADAEFEKWSRSINSEFDEIDKFEVSIS